MVSLHQTTVTINPNGQGNELFGCAYTPDSAFVLTGGWDGSLRLWEAEQGTEVAAIAASAKPLAACAVSPDGATWLYGSMEGMLGSLDALSHEQKTLFLAHTRPISSLVYGPDGTILASASWDRNITLWPSGSEREGRIFAGHGDIVAGCCFTPDGTTLISWSHDKTIRLWDVARPRLQQEWKGHLDRVTAGGISPDGRWFASGARDRLLKLWDLHEKHEVKAILLGAEVRACLFLLDAESLVVVDAQGRLTVHNLPALEIQSELLTNVAVQCAQLAPSGAQIALACGGGELHLVHMDGVDAAPLAITAQQLNRSTANMLQRLLGVERFRSFYRCTCPACRKSFELPAKTDHTASPCPNCRRPLRICAVTQDNRSTGANVNPRGRNSGVRRRA